MPTISVSRRDLENLLQKSLTLPELKKSLQLAKGEIKVIEEDELRIELADTNRPDLLCVEGIARQIRRQKTEVGSQTRPHTEWVRKSEVAGEIIVDPELRDIRPYIGGFLALGVPLDESILIALIQSQEKLADGFGRKRKNIAIGVYNANQLEFPIFYKAVPPESKKFVPLDFDRELNLKEILTLHPKGKEYGYILKGIHKFPFLEDNKGRVLSFPPIINSRLTGEVKAGDTNIFCEVTGTDIEQLALIVNILAANLKDRGAEIYPCVVKYPYPTNFGKEVSTPYDFKTSLNIHLKEFENLLGTKLISKKIKENLENMGYKVKIIREKRVREAFLPVFEITPPPYRRDVMHPVDVIEDFATSRGYESFKPAPLTEFTLGKPAPIEMVVHKVREVMIGCGFEEMMSNILTSKSSLLFWVGTSRQPVTTNLWVEVENPVSESYEVLRNSIIPSLLSVEAQSSKATYPHQIFEVSEVVVPDTKAELKSKTQFKLAALIAHRQANFSELHSKLNSLAYYLDFSYELKKIEHASFIKGRVGSIRVNDKKIGILGEIHPEVLENWRIKFPVAVFELSLNFLL